MNWFKSLLSLGLNRTAAPSKPRRSRVPLTVEALEDRVVPSTILWTNRGSAGNDSDGFNEVFGSKAATARAVVDGALRSWQNVIADFNYSDGSNTFKVDIAMDTANGHGGYAVSGTKIDANGKPMAGKIRLGRGSDGAGAGWFLDPTPNDSAEFRGAIINAFAGNATSTGPADGMYDFFTLVANETTHILGLNRDPDEAFQKNAHGYLVNTGQPDTVTNAGTLFTFNGPSVQALFTSNNGGAGGTDTGKALHTAEPGNFYQSKKLVRYAKSGPIFSYGPAYYGVQDSDNVYYEQGRRYLPSQLDALVLKDAYGYTIVPPQTFGTFYANLDSTTGNLLVRGPFGMSDDTIAVWAAGTPLQLHVSVDVGDDVPGTGPTGALLSKFALGEVHSITIEGGDGDDTIDVTTTAVAGKPVMINGGAGSDTVRGRGSYTNWHITGFNAGDINGTSAIRFFATENLESDTFLGKGGWFIFNQGAAVSGKIQGGSGMDTLDYSAYSTPIFVDMTAGNATGVFGGIGGIESVLGGSGDDTLTGNAANNTLRGGAGKDWLRGQGGNDILLGEAGNDRLEDSSGRNILIGGLGADVLTGGSDDDLLIAGTTAFDTFNGYDTALLAILAEWQRTDRTYMQRVDTLRSGIGLGAGFKLNSSTVSDDTDVDVLTGSGGQDWFWGDLTKDSITDGLGGEFVN